MTFFRFDTVVANLPAEQRRELLGRVFAQMTDAEVLDALSGVWDRVQERAESLAAREPRVY